MFDDYDFDYERLRRDLEDDYLGIMFNVSKAAVIYLSRVENATYDELIEIAKENGYNLEDYRLNQKRIFF